LRRVTYHSIRWTPSHGWPDPTPKLSLIEEALGLSNHALDRLARLANPPQLRDEHRSYHRRSLFMQWNLDESELKLNGNLPATQGEIVQEALESRAVRYGPNPSTGMFDAFSTRLADALVEMAATTSDSSPRPPQVSVHVDLDALVSEEEGVTELFTERWSPTKRHDGSAATQ
jgi:hypothetical protein